MHAFSTIALALTRYALGAAVSTVVRRYDVEVSVTDERTGYAPRLDGSRVEGWTVCAEGARFSVDATGFYAVREADESNPIHAALYFAIAGLCEGARA